MVDVGTLVAGVAMAVATVAANVLPRISGHHGRQDDDQNETADDATMALMQRLTTEQRVDLDGCRAECELLRARLTEREHEVDSLRQENERLRATRGA